MSWNQSRSQLRTTSPHQPPDQYYSTQPTLAPVRDRYARYSITHSSSSPSSNIPHIPSSLSPTISVPFYSSPMKRIQTKDKKIHSSLNANALSFNYKNDSTSPNIPYVQPLVYSQSNKSFGELALKKLDTTTTTTTTNTTTTNTTTTNTHHFYYNAKSMINLYNNTINQHSNILLLKKKLGNKSNLIHNTIQPPIITQHLNNDEQNIRRTMPSFINNEISCRPPPIASGGKWRSARAQKLRKQKQFLQTTYSPKLTQNSRFSRLRNTDSEKIAEPAAAVLVLPSTQDVKEKETVDESLWWYRDPTGHEQGSFTRSQMSAWFKQAYFPKNLPVRHHRNTPFIELHDWFAAGLSAFCDEIPDKWPNDSEPIGKGGKVDISQKSEELVEKRPASNLMKYWLKRMSASDSEEQNKDYHKNRELTKTEHYDASLGATPPDQRQFIAGYTLHEQIESNINEEYVERCNDQPRKPPVSNSRYSSPYMTENVPPVSTSLPVVVGKRRKPPMSHRLLKMTGTSNSNTPNKSYYTSSSSASYVQSVPDEQQSMYENEEVDEQVIHSTSVRMADLFVMNDEMEKYSQMVQKNNENEEENIPKKQQNRNKKQSIVNKKQKPKKTISHHSPITEPSTISPMMELELLLNTKISLNIQSKPGNISKNNSHGNNIHTRKKRHRRRNKNKVHETNAWQVKNASQTANAATFADIQAQDQRDQRKRHEFEKQQMLIKQQKKAQKKLNKMQAKVKQKIAETVVNDKKMESSVVKNVWGSSVNNNIFRSQPLSTVNQKNVWLSSNKNENSLGLKAKKVEVREKLKNKNVKKKIPSASVIINPEFAKWTKREVSKLNSTFDCNTVAHVLLSMNDEENIRSSIRDTFGNGDRANLFLNEFLMHKKDCCGSRSGNNSSAGGNGNRKKVKSGNANGNAGKRRRNRRQK